MLDSYNNWFRQAGLGMFIHWGIFSVHGRGEWCPYQEMISIQEYDQRYMDSFTANEYNPEAWAYYAKRAGMEYMVLTTKHHDGFCLFDTQTTNRNALQRGPKCDLVKPFVDACRKYGLRCGLYFSLPDWNEPAFFSGPKLTPEAWQDFLSGIVFAQVRELCTNYGKIDLLWYDNIIGMSNGMQSLNAETNFRNTEQTKEVLTAEDYRSVELNAMVRSLQPDILINDRSLTPEDFYTAEQNLIQPKEKNRMWEGCITMNKHWGWYPADPYYKTIFEILHSITCVACHGGHLMLNVGPDRYGRLNIEEKQRLEAVGDWMKINAEAVKGVYPTDLSGGSYGCASQKGQYVYLYIHFANIEGYITIPGCMERFCSATLLGEPERKLPLETKGGNLIIHNTPMPEYNKLPVIRLERAP